MTVSPWPKFAIVLVARPVSMVDHFVCSAAERNCAGAHGFDASVMRNSHPEMGMESEYR